MTKEFPADRENTFKPQTSPIRRVREWVQKTLRLGDLLTVVTILISVWSLNAKLQQDFHLRQREQANTIRTSAAEALTNLETLQSLVLSLFDVLQPTYVNISQKLYNSYSIGEARDFLWLTITQEISNIDGAIIERQIVTGYADLLVDFPEIREPYLGALTSISGLTAITAQDADVVPGSAMEQSRGSAAATPSCDESSIYDNFLCESEKYFLLPPWDESDYQSAILGSLLRRTSDEFRRQLREETDKAINPIRECVLRIIHMSDSDLLSNPICQLVSTTSTPETTSQSSQRMDGRNQ